MSNADPSLCCFGAEAITKRLATMLRLTDDVRRGDDVDAVHDMRVASRRTRTAVRLFADCFPSKKVKRWNKRLKRVTKALGEARDTDVQIELVQGVLKATAERKTRPGLRRLLLRLKQRRERFQPDVIAALDKFEKHKDLADLQASLQQETARGDCRHLDARTQPVFGHVRQVITTRLQEMLAYEPYVERPECIAELHQMRIAAKHLRYAMEVFKPLYDGALDDAIGAAKDVQRRLGEIHDCDVWVAALPAFIEQERQRTLEYFGREGPVRTVLPGIEYLREERQAQRDAEYRSFVESWHRLQQQDAWHKLLLVLECPVTGSAQSGESNQRTNQEPNA